MFLVGIAVILYLVNLVIQIQQFVIMIQIIMMAIIHSQDLGEDVNFWFWLLGLF
jgi:hypothetical protein